MDNTQQEKIIIGKTEVLDRLQAGLIAKQMPCERVLVHRDGGECQGVRMLQADYDRMLGREVQS